MREQLLARFEEYRQETAVTDALIADQLQELRVTVSRTVARSTRLFKEVVDLQRDLVVSNAKAISKGITLVMSLNSKKAL